MVPVGTGYIYHGLRLILDPYHQPTAVVQISLVALNESHGLMSSHNKTPLASQVQEDILGM